MAGRSGDTFKKRQKEVARAEKHREKLAKRLERKPLPKESPDSEEGTTSRATIFGGCDAIRGKRRVTVI